MSWGASTFAGPGLDSANLKPWQLALMEPISMATTLATSNGNSYADCDSNRCLLSACGARGCLGVELGAKGFALAVVGAHGRLGVAYDTKGMVFGFETSTSRTGLRLH